MTSGSHSRPVSQGLAGMTNCNTALPVPDPGIAGMTIEPSGQNQNAKISHSLPKICGRKNRMNPLAAARYPFSGKTIKIGPCHGASIPGSCRRFVPFQNGSAWFLSHPSAFLMRYLTPTISSITSLAEGISEMRPAISPAGRIPASRSPLSQDASTASAVKA